MTIDLTNPAHYGWALLPEILLTLGASAILLGDVLQKGSRPEPSGRWVAPATLATVIAALVATAAVGGATVRGATTAWIALDPLRAFLNAVILLTTALAAVVAPPYLERTGLVRAEFYALLLFAAAGAMLLAAAQDLLFLFLALELMSVSVYVLTGFRRRDPRAVEGALKYFLLGAFSSAFLLYGVALVFGATGTTHLTAIRQHLAAGAGASPMLGLGLALLLVGLGFKVTAMPFHVWAPDAYDGAPTPVTGFMATAVKAAAFGALVRVVLGAFGPVRAAWEPILWWLSALTMLGGNLVALGQGSVKRMLAYSSIAHAGYLLTAVVAGTPAGVAAFLFYIVVYTIMTVVAFAIVMANAFGTDERHALENFAGFGWRRPLLGGIFAVALLSLAGFPLTAGFLGKLYILRAAVDAGHTALAVLLVLGSLISYFYYLRVVILMYMRPAPEGQTYAHARLPGPATATVALGGALLLVLFFAPLPLVRAADRSAAALPTAASTVAGRAP